VITRRPAPVTANRPGARCLEGAGHLVTIGMRGLQVTAARGNPGALTRLR